MQATQRYTVVAIILFGTAVRLAVWYANPPNNAYDDHLEAIAYFARHLARPPPDHCWQCYQPPLYHGLCAVLLRVVAHATGSSWIAWRAVQLASVGFSVAQLVVCWRILSLVGARSFWPGAAALLVAASLPRDIYAAAFISNDAALGLVVSLSLLFYLRAVLKSTGRIDARDLALVLVTTVAAAWTKQSGLLVAVLPMWMLALVAKRVRGAGSRAVERRRLILFAAATFVALAFSLGDEFRKASLTGHFPVSNQHLFALEDQEPGELSRVAFTDFRFRALLQSPTLSRETVDSFWTEVFARLWFDYEPTLLPESEELGVLAVVSYCLGLAIVCVWALGCLRGVKLWYARLPLYAIAIVQLGFILVPVVQTFRFPYYSSMKAMFLLPAASLAAVFVSLGFELLWRFSPLRLFVVVIAVASATVATLQGLSICMYN